MESERIEPGKKETFRIEAFSEGVFAIVITLLASNIHVPVLKINEILYQAVIKDWETYLAFLTGFFTLLICWINHHYMFEFIYRQNGMLLLYRFFL